MAVNYTRKFVHSELIVHSVNTERSMPAKRSVHHVPLDDTLMVVADDFLSPELVLELELGFADSPDPEASENKTKEEIQ